MPIRDLVQNGPLLYPYRPESTGFFWFRASDTEVGQLVLTGTGLDRAVVVT